MRGVSIRLLLTLALLVPAAAARAGEAGLPAADLQALLHKYQELRTELGNSRYVALLNYRQPSWEKRFYVIDPATRAVVGRYVVAHGRGSDPAHTGYAQRFSDRESSHMSSLGFFRTGDTYVSESRNHGLSLRLQGLSDSNRSAEARAIVVHANKYMEPGFLRKHGKPGRSHGCLVFAPADRDAVVGMLQGGALIYAAYSPVTTAAAGSTAGSAAAPGVVALQ